MSSGATSSHAPGPVSDWRGIAPRRSTRCAFSSSATRRHLSQATLAGRLEVTQGAISKLEHADDVRVSTLRQYLNALGARLEMVAVFDDDDRRVPITLGTDQTTR